MKYLNQTGEAYWERRMSKGEEDFEQENETNAGLREMK